MFNLHVIIFTLLFIQEEKLAMIHAANPNPVSEAELGDSAVITAPSEEEQAEE